MTTEQLAIKQSDLLNRLVLDRDTAEEVGRVDQLWLNPQSQQVLGFTCKSGMFSNKKRAFTWAQIHSIGTDSIIVNCPPEGIEAQKPEQVVPIIGHEVFSEAGNKAGKLVDYLIQPQTATAIGYLYSSSGWRGVMDGIYLLAPESIVKIGSKRVMVADAALQVPQKYAEGLTHKLGQAAEMLKEDYEKTKRDIETVKHKSQNFAEQAKDQAQNVTAKAKERAQIFAEQAKDQAQNVTARAKEGAQNFAEQAKDQAQNVTARAKEGAQNFAEQAKDQAQNVTARAKEGAQILAEHAKDQAQNATARAKETVSGMTAKPETISQVTHIEIETVEEITVEPPPKQQELP